MRPPAPHSRLKQGMMTLLVCVGVFVGCIHAIPADEKSLPVPAVVTRVRPSVVTIITRGVPAGPSQHVSSSGSGSGIIIDPSGYILTNNHLVEGVKSLVVGLPTGRLVPGRVVARDFLLDLALVKIVAQDLVPAKLSQRMSLEIGESVIAIGNPLNPLASKGGSSVTVGVVSALGRAVLAPNGETLYDLIQTDAAINPGNSGGPLVDLSGQVVGVNVVVDPSAQAISYAIPTEAVYPHIQSMMLRGSVLRPDFGFTPLTVTPSIAASFGLEADRGVLVLNVDPAKPAGAAGLQNGDVITALDQHQLYNMGDFWHSVMRDGEQPVMQVTVQSRTGQSIVNLPRPPAQKGAP